MLDKRMASNHTPLNSRSSKPAGERIRSLIAALSDLGFGPGDRIGTLGWNHCRHLKTYFASPLSSAHLHTIESSSATTGTFDKQELGDRLDAVDTESEG